MQTRLIGEEHELSQVRDNVLVQLAHFIRSCEDMSV